MWRSGNGGQRSEQKEFISNFYRHRESRALGDYFSAKTLVLNQIVVYNVINMQKYWHLNKLLTTNTEKRPKRSGQVFEFNVA